MKVPSTCRPRLSLRPTARTFKAFRPAAPKNIAAAGRLIAKPLQELLVRPRVVFSCHRTRFDAHREAYYIWGVLASSGHPPIQIPCYNEAASIEETLNALPRAVEGFDAVEWLVIDDGCTDDTVAKAKARGIDHVVRFEKNRGLAKAFMAGVDRCLALGADVIVNTDGDGQYKGSDIPALLAPILAGRAAMSIGHRITPDLKRQQPLKAALQVLGNRVVSMVCGVHVPDAPSGFRALTRDAALQLHVFNNYTYTLETIIQARWKNLAIEFVPVHTNPPRRSSRLMTHIGSYVHRSILIIGRTIVIYKPFRFFFRTGLGVMALGILLGLYAFYAHHPWPHNGGAALAVIAGILLLIGLQLVVLAFVADLLAVNRQLLEDIQYRLRKGK